MAKCKTNENPYTIFYLSIFIPKESDLFIVSSIAQLDCRYHFNFVFVPSSVYYHCRSCSILRLPYNHDSHPLPASANLAAGKCSVIILSPFNLLYRTVT